MNAIEFKKILSQYKYIPKRQIEILGKTVNIPVVYPDASAVMIFLPASLDKVNELLGSHRITPVRLFRNRCLLAITLFDYRRCDIGPYREFTISVPVLVDSKFNPPILPLLFDIFFKSLGFYVLMLGASSDIARKHIEKIFPYPLYERDIEVKMEQDEERRLSSSLLEVGRKIITINNPLSNFYKFQKKMYNTYYKKDGEIFHVKLNTFSFLKQSLQRKDVSINFEDHPLSDYIKDICISDKPLGYLYYKKAIEIASYPKSL